MGDKDPATQPREAERRLEPFEADGQEEKG